MKGIKPFKLGMLTRPFQWGAEYHLGVSVISYFPFEPADELLTDMELFAGITDLLGDQPILDVGIPKSRSEYLVMGNAYPPGGQAATTCPVRVKVGAQEKRLYVVGDRFWRDGVPTEPIPFTEMDLGWARSFGGEGFEENPLGKGFAAVAMGDAELHPLPNVEAPGQMVNSLRDRPTPAGFGRVDFTWPQRRKLAGTYDNEWLETRYPGFAKDLDWRIWNMAPPDQWRDERFRPLEPLLFENLHPTKPRLTARLPNLIARCFLTKRDETGAEVFSELTLEATTVWLFPNVERGVVIYQGATPTLEDDATDVINVMIAGERPGQPRGLDHYRAVLAKRLDPTNAVEVLNDADLMPEGLTGMGGEVEKAYELTSPEGLRLKRSREKAAAEIEATREHVASLGLDPDEHGPQPLPPEDDPVSLSELPEFMKAKVEEIEKMKADADAERVVRDAETEAFFIANGLDYGAIEAEKKTVPYGPPDFKADDYRDMLRKMADDAAAAGAASDELEYYASDPEYYAILQKYEEMALDGYRIGAHFQGAAPLLSGEAASAVRLEVEQRHRAGEGFGGVDLTGADLSSMDLAGANFGGALLESVSFEGANLAGANFEGAVLAHADLTAAKVRGARFVGANLGNAKLICLDSGGEVDLSDTILWKADLTGAVLRGANLEGAVVLEADLSNADLSRARAPRVFFHRVRVDGATFTGIEARLAVFLEIDASGLDFSGAMLEEAVFLKSSAVSARFVNAQMTNFRFVESVASGADFKGAVLDKANLRGADLRMSDFSGAKLNGTDLSEARCEGSRFYRIVAKASFWMKTDLREASMVSADLFEAMLQKADLRGTDLRHSNLYGADFAQVHADTETKLEGAIQLKVRYKPVRQA